jgi:hypothetical protein
MLNNIGYDISTDGGTTFGPTENLSNNGGLSLRPAITGLGINVYMVWTDNTIGNFDIFYRASTDGGITFGPTENLSNNLGDSSSPAVSLSVP